MNRGPRVAETRLARRSDSTVEVLVDGAGPLVLMIPSLGRGAEDFEDLSRAVVKAGYRVGRLQPRGIGRSTGVMEGLSLLDLAEDAAAGIEAAGKGPAVVLGHAFWPTCGAHDRHNPSKHRACRRYVGSWGQGAGRTRYHCGACRCV